MDRHRTTAVTRPLTSLPSRRDVLRGLTGVGLGIVAARGQQATDARKKRKKTRKKKRPGQTVPPPPAPVTTLPPPGLGTTPPPPGPLTTADAACPGPYIGVTFGPRFAQTFRALRSGRLTSASVELHSNDEGADFDMEIWAVDAANAPSTVLAGTTIANVPETVAPGPRTLAGTFPAPATVVAGVRYALVVTGQVNQTFRLRAHGDNVCPDGVFFIATTPDGAFTAAPTSDLGFATFVTA